MPNKRKPKPPPKKPPKASQVLPFSKRRQGGKGRPFKKGEPRPANAGRKKGTGNYLNSDLKEFYATIFEEEDYRKALRERLLAGKAQTLELLGWHHIVGKPAETVAVQTSETLKELWALAAKR